MSCAFFSLFEIIIDQGSLFHANSIGLSHIPNFLVKLRTMEGSRFLEGSRAGLFGCRFCTECSVCPDHRHLEHRQHYVSDYVVFTTHYLAPAQDRSDYCV